jgi:hypothetical protein
MVTAGEWIATRSTAMVLGLAVVAMGVMAMGVAARKVGRH